MMYINCNGIKTKQNKIEWTNLLTQLYTSFQLCHILIEGGNEIFSSALEADIIDKINIFITPLLMGGPTALNAVNLSKQVKSLSDCYTLIESKWVPSGQDILITGYPKKIKKGQK